MKKIIIEINSCKECPYFEISNISSTDGWDRGEDWFCKKAEKTIAGFVEWHEKIEIPDWCPATIKKEN